jgi:hypothetical protein
MPLVHLSDQQALLLLRPLALGDVARDLGRPDDAAFSIPDR